MRFATIQGARALPLLVLFCGVVATAQAQSTSGQSGTAQTQTGQSGTADTQSGQSGTAQPQTGQGGTADTQSGQSGTAQPQTGQGGTADSPAGQSGTAQSQSGQSGTADSPAGQSGSGQSHKDQAFVKKALAGGNAEIELGKLASQKGESDDVKQFGQKMIDDHTKMGDQLKPVAQQLNVAPPTEVPAKDKKLSAKMENLSGSEFDREYIKAMLKDHQEDLAEFKSEAASTQNADLKQIVDQAVTIISEHLEMIQQIAQKHNVAGGATTAASAQ